MADISTGMKITGISEYVSSLNQAKNAVKTLDSELKRNEAQFKATGDKEQYMADKARLLQMQLKTQSAAAKSAEAALKEMRAKGVDQMSASYQKMQQELSKAQTGALESAAALNELNRSEQEAAKGADQLTTSVNGIGKKISLEQVTSAIGKITDGMERAAKKAIEFGQQLWDIIMESAKRADDTATMAQMYGIDIQQFKQMQALVQNGMDTTVDSMLGSMDKLKKGIGSGSDDVMNALKDLNLTTQVVSKSGEDWVVVQQDLNDLFFQTGQAIMGLDDIYQQEDYAQKLFGKSWKELTDLFENYKTYDEYKAALDEITVSSEDSTKNLQELNDAVAKLEGTWTTLKDEIVGAIAPNLTTAADSLSALLDSLLQYLQSPEGQAALSELSSSISTMFEGLGEVTPDDVVSTFSSVLGTVVDSFTWIKENWSAVEEGIKAIGAAFLGLKLAEAGLTFINFANGLKGLIGGGGGAGAGAGAAAGGSSMFTSIQGWLSSLGSGLANLATTLTTYDASGALALLPQVFGDQFAFGRALRDGGSIGDAFSRGWEEFKNSAAEGLSNFGDYFTKTLPEAFWGMFGLDENKLQQAGENLKIAAEFTFGDEYSSEELMAMITGEENAEVKVEPVAVEEANEMVSEQIGDVPTEIVTVVPENAAELISKSIGAVNVQVIPSLTIGSGAGSGAGGGSLPHLALGADDVWSHGNANGIWSVPWDGYLSVLHKGERVIPAREANSNNYSSNLYVESMYMNNGTDADGLAAAMAAAQRRTRAGYGS